MVIDTQAKYASQDKEAYNLDDSWLQMDVIGTMKVLRTGSKRPPQPDIVQPRPRVGYYYTGRLCYSICNFCFYYLHDLGIPLC